MIAIRAFFRGFVGFSGGLPAIIVNCLSFCMSGVLGRIVLAEKELPQFVRLVLSAKKIIFGLFSIIPTPSSGTSPEKNSFAAVGEISSFRACWVRKGL